LIRLKTQFSVNGIDTAVYTIADGGFEADILTYGGRITRLTVPDRDGVAQNVVCGPAAIEDYIRFPQFYGALIGRYGNRIGGAAFALNGVRYELEKNEGANTLHGGFHGFDKKVWQAEMQGSRLILSLDVPDGEGGYPGRLKVTVAYTLEAGALSIAYTAVTDKDTVVNLTNHAYFNLAGAGDILNQRLTIAADHLTNVDGALIPDGTLIPLKGSPLGFFDKPVGQDIQNAHPLIAACKGYDFNYCLTRDVRDMSKPAASLYDPGSGRLMEVLTNAPAVQLYTSNAPAVIGGTTLGRYAALCLETQNYPDAPNQPGFPSAVLRVGETYRARTVYRFSVRP
jgi:aldose 1-epimerase